MRKRERDLERKQQDVELTVARQIDKERGRIVADTQARVIDEHRLREAEKERQLTDMRRQIEDLKRKAEQGSQQLQGETGVCSSKSLPPASFPSDDIPPSVRECAGPTSIRLKMYAAEGAARSCGSARTPAIGATPGSRS